MLGVAFTAQYPANKDACSSKRQKPQQVEEPKAGENKGRKNRARAGERFFSSRLALRSCMLTKGLALSFLAAKAKRNTMVVSKL